MKITKSQLQQIIKEETESAMADLQGAANAGRVPDIEVEAEPQDISPDVLKLTNDLKNINTAQEEAAILGQLIRMVIGRPGSPLRQDDRINAIADELEGFGAAGQAMLNPLKQMIAKNKGKGL